MVRVAQTSTIRSTIKEIMKQLNLKGRSVIYLSFFSSSRFSIFLLCFERWENYSLFHHWDTEADELVAKDNDTYKTLDDHLVKNFATLILKPKTVINISLPLGQSELLNLDLSLTPIEVLALLAVSFGWLEALDEYALKVKNSKGKLGLFFFFENK